MSQESEYIEERKSKKYKEPVVVSFEEYRKQVEEEMEERRKSQPRKARKTKSGGRGKGKGTRRKKDKNAPKRPRSAFLFFSMDERPRLHKKYPKLKFGPLSKKLGKEWAKVSDEDRRHYDKQAKKDKKRYEEQMVAYDKKKKI